MGDVIDFEAMRERLRPNTNEDDDIPLLDLKSEYGRAETAQEAKAIGNERRNGWIGWVVIWGFTAGWDMSRNETLTNAAARGNHSESRTIRYATRAAIGYVALHLLDAIPTQYDLFDRVMRAYNERR